MKKESFISKRYFLLTLLVLSVFSISIFIFERSNNKVSAEITPPVTPENNLLQFTSDNHAIGFANDGVFVAQATHMMKVNFVNSNNITPTSESSSTTTTTTDKANPLSKVTYKNVWNGIDAIYESQDGSLMKSTYIVDKNISSDNIKFKYNRPVSLDKNNNLVIKYDTGIITESAPVAWQEINNTKVPVTVNYKITNEENNEVGFSIGNYNKDFPLIIDPTYDWIDFLGGSGTDTGYSIAVDTSGNVYITGYSTVTWGNPIRAKSSGNDAFVAKLDSSGNLLWNTFLGGNGSDYGRSIVVDTSGNVYIGGDSTATWGSPLQVYMAENDAFVVKLDSSGTLLWNTFLGGWINDDGKSIAVDESGNVYVGGYSNYTWGSPIRAHSTRIPDSDVYVAKLNSSGTLLWNTFLGVDWSDDYGTSIAVDTSGNVYITGYSTVTWGNPIRAKSSGNDALVAKLDSSGNLLWNTFLGGSGSDSGHGLILDASGNLYISGSSGATWQGTSNPIRAYTSGSDAFVAKLDNSGTLLWNTFLGGVGSAEQSLSIDIDTSGNLYISGSSDATWQGTSDPVRAYTSLYDAFASKLDSSGVLMWNTFLGGSGYEYGFSIAVATTSGNVYVGGYSDATWGSPVRAYTLDNDAFAVKLTSAGALATISTPNTITSSSGSNGTITPSGATSVEDGADQTFTITPSTNYHVADILVDDVSVGTSTTYTFSGVTADHTISATFATDTKTLTYTAGSNGSIIGTSTQTINYGSNGTEITAVPNAGYHFVSWSDASTTNPRTDTNVTDNISISATFEADPVSVTPSSGGGGGRSKRFLETTHPPVQTPITASSSSQTSKSRNLTLGSQGNDVKTLQVILNIMGYTVSPQGLGSPNNESTYFGEKTKQALIKFQLENGVTPANGYFGPKTRDILIIKLIKLLVS